MVYTSAYALFAALPHFFLATKRHRHTVAIAALHLATRKAACTLGHLQESLPCRAENAEVPYCRCAFFAQHLLLFRAAAYFLLRSGTSNAFPLSRCWLKAIRAFHHQNEPPVFRLRSTCNDFLKQKFTELRTFPSLLVCRAWRYLLPHRNRRFSPNRLFALSNHHYLRTIKHN